MEENNDRKAKVTLVVDGKKVPLNSYVRSVFSSVIVALISTLKGVDENWKTAEIKVER
ncbi:hypothetical protein [Archaeoglobus veneficus]|uniref:Uncharacterized protein n=1 Tax=Archaeoglobus veneficus (strain DSM 11195 / SNP6) TaxID=693661 RepID=F2KP06_ARCVS|nr:hypothetical protein [Archaeoglobus veneficus]AEA46314.1 hypothetical protein Arcve_0279 [Archaeoglobus veneficus SNP6]